jgi:hypothetical protein
MRKVSAILLMVVSLCFAAYSQKRLSDAENEGLKGKVQEVIHERAKLELKDGKWNTLERQVSSTATYGPQGTQLSSKSYDERGNHFLTITFFEVDGHRAMNRQFIRQSYDPPPASGQQSPSRADPRYDVKYIDKYDEGGRRSEVMMIGHDGKVLNLRINTFDEAGQLTEMEYWSQRPDKQPSRIIELDSQKIELARSSKSVYRYDQQGNLTESFSLDDNGTPRNHVRYEQYEFDANKNWTKRTRVKVELKNWKESLTPEAIEYQVIKYYP